MLWLLLFFLAGYLLRRLKRTTDKHIHYVNQYILYIPLPAIILLNIPKLEFSLNLIPVIIAGWIGFFISGFL